MIKINNFIDNQWIPPQNEAYLENFDPSIGKVYSLLANSDARDVDVAVTAASKAAAAWKATSTEERARLLNKVADLILQNSQRLAEAESRDNGKPLSLAKAVDIPRSESNFRYFARAVQEFSEQAFVTHTPASALNYTLHQPLGVVVCISPWNLPLYLLTWKIAPALAMGNTVVAKPSEVTPMTAHLLTELFVEAGFPAGVFNMIHGLGDKVGTRLVQHPQVKAISFTGSTATGRKISQLAAENFKKVSLEMGGKNASIIFEDCDFDKTLETTLRSSFSNQGQICLCGSRILVQDAIYTKFKEAFVARTKSLRIGPPHRAATQQGAVVSRVHADKILSAFVEAKKQNANFLCGGEAVQLEGEYASGYYIAPTIIENLPMSSSLNQEEIFGPVVTLMSFRDEKEALQLANQSAYGLSASVWTSNVSRAHRFARDLEVGLVWINTWMLRDLRTPFGGVKNSGVGREGGQYALKFFSEVKNVCLSQEEN